MAPFRAIRCKSSSVGWFFVGLGSASVGRRPNPQKTQPPACGLSAAIPSAICAIKTFQLET